MPIGIVWQDAQGDFGDVVAARLTSQPLSLIHALAWLI